MLFDLMLKCMHCIFFVSVQQSCRKDMIQCGLKWMSAGVRNLVYCSRSRYVIRLDFKINLSSLPLSCRVFCHSICRHRRYLMYTVKNLPNLFCTGTFMSWALSTSSTQPHDERKILELFPVITLLWLQGINLLRHLSCFVSNVKIVWPFFALGRALLALH